MCGICGFTGEVLDRDEVIKRMTDVITHRGPDSSGVFAGDGVTMGFRRLSIIDVGNTGDQPIYNEDRTLVLTFNGEIYNYQDLRKELLEKGHKFYTNTDFEVLVHGFEEWKEGLLNRLRGMFGFAIWNTVDNSLFLARDYFGIKPLHYTQVGDSFVYGSEIKSILEFPGFQKKFNRHALDNYISFEYAPPPETFFENVFCLMPAHYLWYKDGKVTTTRYWEPKFDADESMTEEQAVDAIEKVFEESVAAHKISDVEVGCFLSSGVDSSYVVKEVSKVAKDVKTFSVGYEEEKYSELPYAQDFSKTIGVQNISNKVSADDYFRMASKIQWYMDEPLPNPSEVPLYFLAENAAKYVKVVLSGEGADELFGGYPMYLAGGHFEKYSRIPKFLRKGAAALAKRAPDFKGKHFLVRGAMEPYQRFMRANYVFTRDERWQYLKKRIPAKDPVEYAKPFFDQMKDFDEPTQLQYADIHTWMLYDILQKADRMSMANSLELRVPFLDKKMLELAVQIPTRYRIDGNTTKVALRGAAIKQIPERTANKKKLGFPVPLNDWLRQDKYYSMVLEKFEGEIADRFFNREAILKLLNDHKSGAALNMKKIWTIYSFILWYEEFFVDDAAAHPASNP